MEGDKEGRGVRKGRKLLRIECENKGREGE